MNYTDMAFFALGLITTSFLAWYGGNMLGKLMVWLTDRYMD